MGALYDRYGHSLEPPRSNFGPFDGGDPFFQATFDSQFDGVDLEELLREAMRAGAGQGVGFRKPGPPTVTEIWDGVLGLALVGVIAAMCWAAAPIISSWSCWFRWRWRFFIHDRFGSGGFSI